MVSFTMGALAEWLVILGGLVSVYIGLRLRIESVAAQCTRKEELIQMRTELERYFDMRFESLKELIGEKIRHHEQKKIS